MADDLEGALDTAGGEGQAREGVGVKTFLASLATAAVIFSVQFLLFLVLKSKFTRI